MSEYIRHNWAPGEEITSGRLNNMEQGITEGKKAAEDSAAAAKAAREAANKHAARHAKGGTDPLTLEMLGAAPSGYGLGTSATYITDLNNAKENGFYHWNTAAVNAPFNPAHGGGEMIVLKRNENAAHQIAYDATRENLKCVRQYSVGTWGEWEWVNPPMSLGVEYRTTERYQGSPVYVKLIDAGILPNNSTKYVESAIVNGITKVVDVKLNMYSGSGMAQRTNDSRIIVTVNVESPFAWLAITANEDFSTYSGHVVVKYTK